VFRSAWHRQTPALLIVLVGAACSYAEPLDYRAGAIERDEPQAVYADDPKDAWNRVFYELFTRTVVTRLSDEYPEGSVPVSSGQRFDDQLGKKTVRRIEVGDRAIDPLYPHPFLSRSTGVARVLEEPHYSTLSRALTDALATMNKRSPLARALMQADAWAAYDRLLPHWGFDEPQQEPQRQRKMNLVQLLAKLIRASALERADIARLPNNYAAAARLLNLPDLLHESKGWMEVEWHTRRAHEESAECRRTARVFIKPKLMPQGSKERSRFVGALRNARNFGDQLEAVALLSQLLLIDSQGKVTPSPLTFEVQLRSFRRDAMGAPLPAELVQCELSRRKLLTQPKTGGLERLTFQAPAYLPTAGNDYEFASQWQSAEPYTPILSTLRTRCAVCHHQDGTHVTTFSLHGVSQDLKARELCPLGNERAIYTTRLKSERDDFKSLVRDWP